MNLDGWSLYTEYIIDIPDYECKSIEERHYKRYIKEVDGVWYYQDVLDQRKPAKRGAISESTVSYDLRHSKRVFYPYKIEYKMCSCEKEFKMRTDGEKLFCAYCDKEIIAKMGGSTELVEYKSGVHINPKHRIMKIDNWYQIPAGLIHHFMNATSILSYQVVARTKEECSGTHVLHVMNNAGEKGIFELECIKTVCGICTDELPWQDMHLMGGSLYIRNGDGSYGYIEKREGDFRN